VEITDNGVGIPTDLLPKLFQPFFTTKGATGTGLGLWVSMGIVQKHGGAIKIGNSSEPGLPGASIRVFLPARTLAQSVEKAGC
jgi:signal transduction histidine kinase